MGKILSMARNRKTYRGQTPPNFAGAQRNPEGDDDAPGQPAAPPAPAAPKSTWLRTGLTIAMGAVVGAVAVDLYRKYTGPSGLGGGGDGDDKPALPAGSAVPNMPQIMPMPMPMPMPFPMPFGGGGFQQSPPPPARPARLTGPERLELARLEKDKAESDAEAAELRAWEAGDLD